MCKFVPDGLESTDAMCTSPESRVAAVSGHHSDRSLGSFIGCLEAPVSTGIVLLLLILFYVLLSWRLESMES